MFLIECPFCREARNETEYSCIGEAFIDRPLEPESLSDEQWADYHFYRTNTKGIFWEQWNHAHGCRKYFVVQRNTHTNVILGSYTLAEGRAHFDKQNKMQQPPKVAATKTRKPKKTSVTKKKVTATKKSSSKGKSQS